MNRNRIAALAAGVSLIAGLVPVAATAQQPSFMAPPVGQFGNRGGRRWPRIIRWSSADSRPIVPREQATGFFVWHDRNTVHVESTDNHWFGDSFRGQIEIRGGKFDNIYDEHDKADTNVRLVAPNRIEFEFNSKAPDVTGFKFNIHDGNRLIFHVGLDGHRTGKIYYGENKTPTYEDPVVFDLHN